MLKADLKESAFFVHLQRNQELRSQIYHQDHPKGQAGGFFLHKKRTL